MIAAAAEMASDDCFTLVLRTGSPWEDGYDVEISSTGECAYLIHPGLYSRPGSSGKFHFMLDRARIEQLVRIIRQVGFFGLKELYTSPDVRNCLRRYIKVVIEGESHIVNTRTETPIGPIEAIIAALNEFLPADCPKMN